MRKLLGTGAAAVLATVGIVPAGAATATSAGAVTGQLTPAGCARAGGHLYARCYLYVERPAAVPAHQRPFLSGTSTCTVEGPQGLSACAVEEAYGLTALSAKHGKGNLVAVVDAYDAPSIASDLAYYRQYMGLPALCSTCFKKVNQTGVQGSYPAADAGWAQEISLDTEMVSAVCPDCKILLVEANSSGFSDLFAAESEAEKLGARVISNSWGTGEFDGESSYDPTLDDPGVDITFSSGDGAYQGGVQYPSASPYVTSVGGTTLTPGSSKRGFTETGWVGSGSPPTQGSGSGCSAYEQKPPWQTDSGCSNRMTADVSAVADAVSTYDTYQASGTDNGWFLSFGTSVASPVVAGVYGLAKNPQTASIAASAAYFAPSKDFFDVTKGSEGQCSPSYFCQAGKGYDGPTGLGSPHGYGAFQVPVTAPATITSVSFTGTSANPTVTIAGSNLWPNAPAGTPESCNAGDTGDDYGSSGLWFSDDTQQWRAGQAGDCIGLLLDSWSPTQVVFGFGNQYSGYPAIQSGDSVSVEAQGTTFSGTLTGPS